MEEIYIVTKNLIQIILKKLDEKIFKFTNKTCFNDDIKSLISNFSEEIKISYELAMKGNIVSSMILLRSTYENMLFSMVAVYNPSLIDKYKMIEKGIQPRELKKEVIENWNIYFSDEMENKENVEKEIKSKYIFLSKFIHVNCTRTAISMIEKSEEDVEFIKYLFILIIDGIVCLYCDFISKVIEEKDNLIEGICFYEIITYSLYVQINADKVKKLKKYDEYLYLELNNNVIEKYRNTINENISEIKAIDDETLRKVTNEVYKTLNESKYSENLKEIDECILRLSRKINDKI